LTKIRPVQIWLTIAILGGAREAIAAPSVGCAAARGNVAIAICSDPKLSRLNREMRGLYRRALFVGDRRSLVAEQWSWVVERNRTCAKKQDAEVRPCVAQALNERIVELRKVLEPVPAEGERLAVAVPQELSKTSPTPASKQNAGCTEAVGVIDRAICGDATLSHWEDRLGKLYQQALDDPSFRAVLADDQQRWIRERMGTCGAQFSTKMTDCVLQMTKRRIEQFVQFINSRDEPQDRASKVTNILSGHTTPPPGLDADAIDRESARADQSEVILADARTCIRKTVGNAEASDEKQALAVVSASCFPEFSKRLSALELGFLAKPSFEMLVHQEFSASK
jgi:uncharacterized protein